MFLLRLLLPQCVQMIGPRLHHSASVREPLCPVVCAANLITLRVRKLKLDQVRIPAHFVQAGGCHRTKAVRDDFVAREAKLSEGGIQRVVAYRAFGRSRRERLEEPARRMLREDDR